jgi:hypothetical protein
MSIKYLIILFVSILLFLSCKQSQKLTTDSFSTVSTDTLLEDSLLNIRAIELNVNKLMAVSSIGDRYSIDLRTNTILKDRVSKDTLNFRASALVETVIQRNPSRSVL